MSIFTISYESLRNIISFMGCKHHLLHLKNVNSRFKSIYDECGWICCYTVSSVETMRFAFRNRHRILSIRWTLKRYMVITMPNLLELQVQNHDGIRNYGNLPSVRYLYGSVMDYSINSSSVIKETDTFFYPSKMNQDHYCQGWIQCEI